MSNFNPPIILQSTETEFQSAIRDEFMVKSAISSELFERVAEFVSDQQIENGEVVGLPIAEFLNWKISEGQSGFAPTKGNTFGLLLHNEDRTPWQAKLNYCPWSDKKGKHAKAYQFPKKSEGCEDDFIPAYLPPIYDGTREAMGFPLEGRFWDVVESDPTIPIVITEGAKKSLCALSNGVVAISLNGINAGAQKGILLPDLARFCQKGRTFVIAFDRDETPETVERVKRATGRLSWLLGKESKGITVKVATWEASQGKGLDDLVVNCGPEALHEAINSAKIPPRESQWMCLDGHNYQLGRWDEVDIQVGKQGQESLADRATWDPNVEFIETYETENKHGKTVEMQSYRVFKAQTNFDLKVSKILEDVNGGGIEFEVSWLDRSHVRTRRALVKTAETIAVKDFITALTRGLKTHLTAKLKPNDLADLIQNRKTQYSRKGGLVYRLADRVGQQDDGTWVFENAQFKADGTLTTEQESRWMFNQSLGEIENIPSPQIAPQNPESIKDLVKALQAFYSPEAMPFVLLTMGFAVMGLHRQEIMKHVGEVASLAIYGEKGGGKSAAQKAAASLYGLQDFSLSDVSVSMFGEYAKSLGSLPIQWDDPIRQGSYAKADEEKVNTALWKLFTGLGRAVRGNSQAPNTIVCVSTNRTLGQGNAAISSRLISYIFPVHPVTRSAGTALKVAMNRASGGLSQILGIPFDALAIEAHGNQLLEHLSEADSRNANALATLAYFTQKFCELADVDFDALTFIKTDICPQTNEQGAGKDSLTDFLEKLAILKAENIAGDWNLTECDSRDGSRYLAVHLSSLWETFEGRFKPNYGQSLIAQLAEDAGGSKNQKRYFVASRENAIAYQRALNAWDMGIAGAEKPRDLKRDRQAKALLIPRSVAEKAGFFPTPETPEPTVTAVEPIAQPTVTTAAAPTPEPIAVPQPTMTAAAVIPPNQPDLGTWDDEPAPWADKDLYDARSTIQKNPTAAATFKPMIPRSQWKQAGIEEVELCAA